MPKKDKFDKIELPADVIICLAECGFNFDYIKRFIKIWKKYDKL